MRNLIDIINETPRATFLRERAEIIARLDEMATKVKVKDGETVHTYWVAHSDPEKAKQIGMKKHRDRHGLGGKFGSKEMADRPLTAEIG